MLQSLEVRLLSFVVPIDSLTADPGVRRKLFSNALSLLKTARQKSVLVTSAAERPMELRSAHDVQNLVLLFGFTVPASIAAVSSHPGSVVLHASKQSSLMELPLTNDL